jgi:cation:H+ antiporter
VIAYGFAFNGTFGRLEGMTLVFFLAVYLYYVFITERRKTREEPIRATTATAPELVTDPKEPPKSARRQFVYFSLGLAGVIISSRVVLWSCIRLATYLKVPEVVIGLTIIAVGTSLPEVGTCIAAARKGQGEIAVGNIIGADILNILWIIGVSAMVNPMQVSREIVHFMFPWMFLIVGIMLLSMRHRHRIGRPKGLILLSLYGLYLLMTIMFFY